MKSTPEAMVGEEEVIALCVRAGCPYTGCPYPKCARDDCINLPISIRAAISAYQDALARAGLVVLPAGAMMHCRRCGDVSETAVKARICKENAGLCQFGFERVSDER